MFGWDDVILGGIGLFGNLFGANKQSKAAQQAAKAQADAARYAADLQAKATAEALAFQRQQADRDYAMAETNRRANYDQWRAREGRLSTAGQWLGLPSRDIPNYVPMSGGSYLPGEPNPNGGPTPTKGGGEIPKTTGDVAKDMALANQIAGTNHTDPQYWIQAGYAKDPQYFFEKMLGKDAGAQDASPMGPYARAAGAAQRPTTAAAYLGGGPNYSQVPVSPGLVMPTYRPMSAGSYL